MSKLLKIKTVDGQPLLTNDQIQKLNSLEDIKDEYIYYIVNSIRNFGFDSVYDKLRKSNQINDRQIILELSEFNSGRYQASLNNRFYTQRIESVKGIFGKCGRCGDDEVTYYEKQTRSSDESMTIFVTCIHCGNAWKS